MSLFDSELQLHKCKVNHGKSPVTQSESVKQRCKKIRKKINYFGYRTVLAPNFMNYRVKKSIT